MIVLNVRTNIIGISEVMNVGLEKFESYDKFLKEEDDEDEIEMEL